MCVSLNNFQAVHLVKGVAMISNLSPDAIITAHSRLFLDFTTQSEMDTLVKDAEK